MINFSSGIRLLLLLLVVGFPAQAIAALAGIESAGALSEAQGRERPPLPVNEVTGRVDWQTGSYGGLRDFTQTRRDDPSILPFGSDLFSGKGFLGVRSDGLTSDYRVMPGDQITLRLWGAVELERIQPVDAQGNIFIPSIGPVKVQGLTNIELAERVRRAVRSVYPENVSVYTNLQGVQPVAVFVTGYVTNPGRYAGTPDDSVLYFIAQAGGIDNDLGSYRDVRILRAGRELARLDLYDFLIQGKLKKPQLRDGDTILVAERAATVLVTGDVVRNYRYELKQNELNGKVLASLARLRSGVSHVLLRGDRDSGPFSTYQSLEEFGNKRLQTGDEVLFSSDWRDDLIVVQLEGSFFGPSLYTLAKESTLKQLLAAVAVPESLTDTASVSIRRKSVADRQKKALDASLQRLVTTYLGAPSSTPEESEIRVREAELIERFVRRASQIQPSGRLVVADDSGVTDLRLQDGDIITLPEVSDSILISGEVLVPQAVVFQPGKTAGKYIEGAGGFTQHADEDRILVVRQNGEVREETDVALRAGDEILVLSRAPTKNLQLAATISQILYQIAVATKVVLDL